MKNKHHVSIATGTDKSLIRLYYDFMMTYSEFNYQFYWRYFFPSAFTLFPPQPPPITTIRTSAPNPCKVCKPMLCNATKAMSIFGKQDVVTV